MATAGLIRGLLAEVKRELKVRRLPVVATGGYAALIASKMPEIIRRGAEPDAGGIAAGVAGEQT